MSSGKGFHRFVIFRSQQCRLPVNFGVDTLEIASKYPLVDTGLPEVAPDSGPPVPAGPAGAAGPSGPAPPPKLGTTVLVAHPSGGGAVTTDFEGSGLELLLATDGQAALAAIERGVADVAIVDGRFEGDGLAFCEQMWTGAPGFPVLLTGPNDEHLITKALSAGADDYLVLPLRSAEVVARVRAVLRRAPRWDAPAGAAQRIFQVGEVRLDPESHEVTLQARRLHLPLREFELLKLLMENAGIVLARTTLISRLWGPLAPLDSTSLEVHIRRLRSKLEEDPANPRRIVTVRGIGYRYQSDR